jgi:hypothetical protein
MEGDSYAGYLYSIRRRARSGGVFYWHWEVRDSSRFTVKTGNAFGSRDIAFAQVRLGRHQKGAQDSFVIGAGPENST